MRQARSALLLSVLVPLTAAVPVLSPPRPAPHPVTPTVRSQALRGVDAQLLDRSGARGFRAAGRPDVLVSRTGLDRFELIGVTWRRTSSPADVTVTVRAHGARGWSAWTALEQLDTPAPREARQARVGTEPLWVGPSDGYQVRVDVGSGAVPPGLRVDLVDPGRSAADARPGAARPLQSAQAAAAMPAVLTRAQWGADERLRRTAPSYSTTIKAGFVHHTATSNNYTEADVPRIIRSIYAYHVKGNGWSDIGYNFLVDKFGRLWEGRYGGMDRAVLGAHTGGFNVDTFAVSAIGNYDKAQASPEAVDAIARVMAWKLAANFRDPLGTTTLTSVGGGTSKYPAGRKVSLHVISGHRDVGSTSCPGGNLYAQVPTIRTLAAQYLGTTMFNPRPSVRSAVYGTGASITTTARVNTDLTWRLEIREVCSGTLVRTLTGTASPTAPISAVWDLTDDQAAAVRPGGYSLSLVGWDATGVSTHVWTSTVTVDAPPVPTAPATAPAPVGRAGFVPVDPIRVYDTREAGHLPVGPRQRVDLRVTGAGRVPETGVAAVALNISAACATAATTITAWPTGAARPGSPALTVPAGAALSAMTVSALGTGGGVSLYNAAGTTELAVHVVGYYPTGAGDVFRPTTPLRLYDSRRDPAGPLTAGASRTVTLPTLSGIPATSMSGALINLTAVEAAGSGRLTVQSPATSREAPTVAFAPGRPVKNRAVARLVDGALTVSAAGSSTHVVVDVVGWWAPAELATGRMFQPRAARRVLDTRRGLGVRAGRVGAGDVVTLRVAGRDRPVPSGARAVVMTLTALDATRSTFVTAWPFGRRRPAVPDLSVPAWRTTSNLVVVRIVKRNRIRLTNGTGSTHLVGDVVGYYP